MLDHSDELANEVLVVLSWEIHVLVLGSRLFWVARLDNLVGESLLVLVQGDGDCLHSRDNLYGYGFGFLLGC